MSLWSRNNSCATLLGPLLLHHMGKPSVTLATPCGPAVPPGRRQVFRWAETTPLVFLGPLSKNRTKPLPPIGDWAVSPRPGEILRKTGGGGAKRDFKG